MSLSLLASILSSTNSKNPGPMRAPPEKGCPRAPMVNKTSPITPARVTTISLCAHVLCRPNRYVKPTADQDGPQDPGDPLLRGDQARPPSVTQPPDLVQPFCVELFFGFSM